MRRSIADYCNDLRARGPGDPQDGRFEQEQDGTVEMIVITDGSRILGLGDLGVNGMPIPVGKLALYVAAAGFHPTSTLPVLVDLGTASRNWNQLHTRTQRQTDEEKAAAAQLMKSSGYLGNHAERPVRDQEERGKIFGAETGATPSGESFYGLMNAVLRELHYRFPNALIQFEDFSNEHAFGLLRKYRDEFLCFNDDIQGTAAVTLAGVLAALRIQKYTCSASKDSFVPYADRGSACGRLREQRIVFFGAGSAAVGVADLLAEGMALEGATISKRLQIGANGTATTGASLNAVADAYKKSNFWLIDSKGLVTSTRGDVSHLQAHKVPYARDDVAETENLKSLAEVVRKVQPTILIGLAGLERGKFTEEVVKTMYSDCGKKNLRPIIFALSNPTSKAECTAEDAYRWTDGNCVFASGSPFDAVPVPGRRREETVAELKPGQCNNMYIFPGVGYGAVRGKATKITNAMFYAAATELAKQVDVGSLRRGCVYPDIGDIRNITAHVASAVCLAGVADGCVSPHQLPSSCRKGEGLEVDEARLLAFLKDSMWLPRYGPPGVQVHGRNHQETKKTTAPRDVGAFHVHGTNEDHVVVSAAAGMAKL